LKKNLDTGQGSGITKDPYEWRRRIKVPPIRKPKDMDAEEFEKLLKVQQSIMTPKMSKDDFVKCLSEPEKYGRRRKYRSAKERMENAMEWYAKQETNWWVNEQMKILWQLDVASLRMKEKNYDIWLKMFIPQCKRVYKQLLKEKKIQLAKDFINTSYDVMTSKKPKQRHEVEQKIINRIRRLTLQRRYYELQQIMDEIRPLIDL